MEPNKPGNKNMPDFDELQDRVIAEPTKQPIFVMKTTLDPKDSTENNPYFKNKDETDLKTFRDYFEE